MSAPSLIARHLRACGRALLSMQYSRVASASGRCIGRLSLVTAAAAIAVGTSSLTLGVSPSLAQEPSPLMTVREHLPADTLSFALGNSRSAASVTPVNLFVRNGETLTSLLARLGVRDPQLVRYIGSRADLRPLVWPQNGQFLSAGVLNDGRLSYLRLYLEGPHKQDSRALEILRNGDILTSSVTPFQFDCLEESLSGTAVGNLRSTAQKLGIPDDVLTQLREVWGQTNNPLTALKKGDSLRLIYERRFADGNFIRNGRLLAVQAVTGGKVHEAYWYSDKDTPGAFFTLSGKASQQTFIRAPIDVVEISSTYAPLRRHPITGVVRPHNGTDFRAPSGTRIFAAADGVISLIRYQPRGYGHYIEIDHGAGRKSVYAHMSRVQKGLKVGQPVSQGNVIGYVGRSGLATGNHLHYELYENGVPVNPMTTDLPDTANLTPFQLAQLRHNAEPMQIRFDLLARSEQLPQPTVLAAGSSVKKEATAAKKGRQYAQSDELANN